MYTLFNSYCSLLLPLKVQVEIYHTHKIILIFRNVPPDYHYKENLIKAFEKILKL